MIDYNKAKHIAESYIEKELSKDFKLANNKLHEHQFVYVFYYKTRHFFSSFSFSDIFMGSGPYIIDKHDASITAFTSGEIEGDVVIRYYNERDYTHNLTVNKKKELTNTDQEIMSQDEIDSFLNDYF